MAKGPAKKKSPAKKKAATKAKSNAKSKAKPKADADFEVTLERKEPRGLFEHIWEARRGLRASFEAQMKQGLSEERLLFYVAFACLMAFFARLPTVLAVSSTSDGQISAPGLVAGSFVAFAIFAPLFLYAVAGLSHLISERMFGGEGSYPSARLALFWSLVLVIPVGLVWAAIVQGLRLSGAERLVEPLGLLVFGFWLWVWTSFLAIAEGFSRLRCFLFALMCIVCISGIAVLTTR